jgi:hypothetical protein
VLHSPKRQGLMTFVPQILCIAAFYKQKPTVDTPYRRYSLSRTKRGRGWQVRLLGGIKWEHENEALLEKFSAVEFAEAEEIYGKKFRELHEAEWTACSPYISW